MKGSYPPRMVILSVRWINRKVGVEGRKGKERKDAAGPLIISSQHDPLSAPY
jgi:hypothetical protein